LLKTIGQTIGVSIFGSIFNIYIIKYFTQLGINGVDPSNLYNSAVTDEQIRLSLNSSLHFLFIILIGIAVISLLSSMIMPKIMESSKTEENRA
jgi:hypothetical protein